MRITICGTFKGKPDNSKTQTQFIHLTYSLCECTQNLQINSSDRFNYMCKKSIFYFLKNDLNKKNIKLVLYT